MLASDLRLRACTRPRWSLRRAAVEPVSLSEQPPGARGVDCVDRRRWTLEVFPPSGPAESPVSRPRHCVQSTWGYYPSSGNRSHKQKSNKRTRRSAVQDGRIVGANAWKRRIPACPQLHRRACTLDRLGHASAIGDDELKRRSSDHVILRSTPTQVYLAHKHLERVETSRARRICKI